MKVEEKDFEPAGLIPRSIIRTVERFQQQLRPETIALGIQEFRISRYQVRVSVRYFFILLLLPITINWGTKNFIIKPLVEYFWNTYGTSLFLNSYQAERAFQEMRDFESQLFFEMLLSNSDDISKNLLTSTQVNTNALACAPLWSQKDDHPKKLSLASFDLLSPKPLLSTWPQKVLDRKSWDFGFGGPRPQPFFYYLWQGDPSRIEELRSYGRNRGGDFGDQALVVPKALRSTPRQDLSGAFSTKKDQATPCEEQAQELWSWWLGQAKGLRGPFGAKKGHQSCLAFLPVLPSHSKRTDFDQRPQPELKHQIQSSQIHPWYKTKSLNAEELEINKGFFNNNLRNSRFSPCPPLTKHREEYALGSCGFEALVQKTKGHGTSARLSFLPPLPPLPPLATHSKGSKGRKERTASCEVRPWGFLVPMAPLVTPETPTPEGYGLLATHPKPVLPMGRGGTNAFDLRSQRLQVPLYFASLGSSQEVATKSGVLTKAKKDFVLVATSCEEPRLPHSPVLRKQGEDRSVNHLFGTFGTICPQLSHTPSGRGQVVCSVLKTDQHRKGFYKGIYQYPQYPAFVHVPLYQKSRNILESRASLGVQFDFANKNLCSLSAINEYFLSNLVEKSNDSTIPKLDFCFTALFQQKTMLLAEVYNQQSITALSNMFGDCIMIVSIILLLRWNAPQFTILKSFLIESFYSFNDAIKCFYIILITDFLVGFHSPRGWEITMEMLLRHLGLPENEEFILLFVGTFPVFLDTAFKYWIFRYLNKISPSTVATYHSMIE